VDSIFVPIKEDNLKAQICQSAGYGAAQYPTSTGNYDYLTIDGE
jgi:hypothetical protein